ncbi:MAG TPA: hypothetical protein VHX68_19810 [Planctomycetaceae bacterium]|nr:hypothetical protein [Planctomycetaceae bacterium]
MRPRFAIAILALAPLILSACNKVDLDVSLSDDKTSILDGRLLGIWEFVARPADTEHECFFVGRKQGSANTLELTMVGMNKDLSVSSNRFNLFACAGKHNYLSMIANPPEKGGFLPQWLLARYELPADGTVHVHLLNYDVFRGLVRQEVLRGNLKGTIEGRRRHSDWVFSLPGYEPQRVTFTDSKEALIRLLDANSEKCFEATPLVFKRLNIGGKLDLTSLPKPSPAPVAATQPAKTPQKSAAKATRQDDSAPELPQSFELLATLGRPGQYEAGKFEAFRSVALRLPWVYVLDRTGTLCVFRVDPKAAAPQDQTSPTETVPPGQLPSARPKNVIEGVGDGDDLKIFGDVLICTNSRGIEAYSLQDPSKPRRVGRTSSKKREIWGQSIVRHGNLAFVVGNRAIDSYDLTVPNKPKSLGTLETKRYSPVGCAAGNFLYVGAVGKNGIATYDISNPTHPTEVSFVPTSHAPFAVFATPDHRLIASLDADDGLHFTSASYISVNGNSAIFALTDPRHPSLIKAYGKSGGRTTALWSVDNHCYLVCQGVVFAVTSGGLKPDSVFFLASTTMDGLPYHGDADGKYAALATDESVVVLRRTNAK